MHGIRSTPTGGRPLPASDRTARSARTAPATAQPAPSRQETLPAASSWRSAQTPLPPASTASSPDPVQQSTPPELYYNRSWLLQRFLSGKDRGMASVHTRG